jgi:hypothetical protein
MSSLRDFQVRFARVTAVDPSIVTAKVYRGTRGRVKSVTQPYCFGLRFVA